MATLLEQRTLVPIGQIKSFGEFGPKYEVLELRRLLSDSDWMVGIRLVETGEEIEYRYSHMMKDPEAR